MAARTRMAPGAAIQVVGLGKQYRIGALQQNNRTFGETLVDAVKRPVRLAQMLARGERPRRTPPTTFWALRDVAFEVPRGQAVGIIGRNGAGKSTLLKILTRITNPDEGFARIRGRVGSLLEVGTGFHGELTGRENIYLNGTILGMRRDEIARKFDEIVDFSGVEQFIDTPVKRYSSGMYLRLAFSVAAHLEPEILLVDEVLAVGDAEFQQKCLGKMSDVTSAGRTVLFVSHNLGAVLALCQRAIVLQQGRVICDAPAEEGVDAYLRSLSAHTGVDLASRTDREGDGSVRLIDAWIADSEGHPLQQAVPGRPLRIYIRYASQEPNLRADFALTVYGRHETKLFHCATRYASDGLGPLPATGVAVCEIAKLPLPPGHYPINLSVWHGGELADRVVRALEVDVVSGDFYGTGKLPSATSGGLLVDHAWFAQETAMPSAPERASALTGEKTND